MSGRLQNVFLWTAEEHAISLDVLRSLSAQTVGRLTDVRIFIPFFARHPHTLEGGQSAENAAAYESQKRLGGQPGTLLALHLRLNTHRSTSSTCVLEERRS